MGDQEGSGHAARVAVALRSRRAALLALAGVGSAAFTQQEAPALERIRARGRLSVAVYDDLPPFSMNGEGIDVDLARALARGLALELSLLRFTAGENMDNDLRNMVWRGHDVGVGPADVMLHVPVDAPLMSSNPRVAIFAPYYRESLVMARDVRRVPKGGALADFAGQKIAVAGRSLAGWLMSGADGGGWREQLITTWKDGAAAARALHGGEVAAAAGQASEFESVLAGDARFVIEPLPVPRMRDGWTIGCAVKREATDLAQAVQGEINTLATSGELERIFARAKLSWRAP